MSTSTNESVRASEITKPSDREIKIERVFDAPVERVWQAFTDPELFAQWWGRGNKLDIEKMELRPGGHWRVVEHGPEGDFGFEGRYREIIPNQRLSQTFEWDGMPGYPSVDTATFEDLGDGRTKIVSHTLFLTAEDRDGMLNAGMEQGLNQSYAALDKLLASMS